MVPLREKLWLSALAVIAAAMGLAAVGCGGGKQGSAPKRSKGPIVLSQQGLVALAATLGRPAYWVGLQPAVNYEVTLLPTRWTYVRYVPYGTSAGSPKKYLTVGTYPVAGAFSVTSRAAAQPGSVTIAVGPGAVAFYRRRRPTNVYVAFSGSDYQIEVFDPSAARARMLVGAGLVRRITGGSGVAVAVTSAGLTKLATALGRPIYWAGRAPSTTYELTKASNGGVYVRYLPRGVAVGASRPYLTVATYPLPRAFATTRAAARQPGAVAIALAGGAAFYLKRSPTSVYLAFRGVGEQVEVFDPSAARARTLVVAGRIRPAA